MASAAVGSVTVVSAAVTATEEHSLVPGEAPGAWRYGLCSCCSECSVCCAVCCCAPFTTGQIYEMAVRSGLLPRAQGLSCFVLTCVLLSLGLLAALLDALSGGYLEHLATGAGNDTAAGDDDLYHVYEADAPPLASRAAEVCMAASSFIMFGVVCTVRAAIRKRDRIPPQAGFADCCEDCCCAFCCNPCTQCLLLRHEGVTSAKYSLCSPTAVDV